MCVCACVYLYRQHADCAAVFGVRPGSTTLATTYASKDTSLESRSVILLYGESLRVLTYEDYRWWRMKAIGSGEIKVVHMAADRHQFSGTASDWMHSLNLGVPVTLTEVWLSWPRTSCSRTSFYIDTLCVCAYARVCLYRQCCHRDPSSVVLGWLPRPWRSTHISTSKKQSSAPNS